MKLVHIGSLLVSATVLFSACGRSANWNSERIPPKKDGPTDTPPLSPTPDPVPCHTDEIPGHLKVFKISEMSPRSAEKEWITVFYNVDRSEDQPAAQSVFGNRPSVEGYPIAAIEYSRHCILQMALSAGQSIPAVLLNSSPKTDGCINRSGLLRLTGSQVPQDCQRL